MATQDNPAFTPEVVAIADLKPHPRNYRGHPDDQIEHIIASIEQHGLYRNVVVAREYTILAGHGVVQALRKMGKESVAVVRLDVDPNEARALKVLTGDNEIGNLIEIHDRELTELLKEIRSVDDLLGTGFDDMMLANLVMVTRPQSEVKDFDEAAEWLGMPEHDPGEKMFALAVKFRSEADRDAFIRKIGIDDKHIRRYAPRGTTSGTLTMWWPPRDGKDDLKSVQFREAGR